MKKILWPVLVIGLALIVVPLAMSMPSKTAAGQRMLDDFNPLMQPASVQTTADYYNEVFVPLGKVAPLINAGQMTKLNGYMEQMGPVLQQNPQMAQDFQGLFGVMAANVAVFSKVNGGLDHYRPLVDTMQANVQDFESVNSLPDFTLFTWFFVVPGVLLVGLAAWGLFGERLAHGLGARRHPAAVS